MRARRIRQINVLELDQAIFQSTYKIGLEMANWLNASLHICMLESSERTEFINSVYGNEENKSHFINRKQVEDIINHVKVKDELNVFGYSIDHFDENDPVKKIFEEISIDESFSILGYNKSSKHKLVLKNILDSDLGNPLMLVPMGKEIHGFHKIVVPFNPQYVTKKKLTSLKWYADQLGVMIDFVHFNQEKEANEMIKINKICEVMFSWIEDLGFSSKINFRFLNADNLNIGLQDYLKTQNNYFLCIIDNDTKRSISTNKINKECLTDIKEVVVIL